MPRNPDHKGASREAFERHQRERPRVLRKVATLLEVWRVCGDKACLRAKACIGPNGGQCAGLFMQALPDEERATFQLALRLRAAGVAGEAAWDEAARIVAENGAESRAPG